MMNSGFGAPAISAAIPLRASLGINDRQTVTRLGGRSTAPCQASGPGSHPGRRCRNRQVARHAFHCIRAAWPSLAEQAPTERFVSRGTIEHLRRRHLCRAPTLAASIAFGLSGRLLRTFHGTSRSALHPRGCGCGSGRDWGWRLGDCSSISWIRRRCRAPKKWRRRLIVWPADRPTKELLPGRLVLSGTRVCRFDSICQLQVGEALDGKHRTALSVRGDVCLGLHAQRANRPPPHRLPGFVSSTCMVMCSFAVQQQQQQQYMYIV